MESAGLLLGNDAGKGPQAQPITDYHCCLLYPRVVSCRAMYKMFIQLMQLVTFSTGLLGARGQLVPHQPIKHPEAPLNTFSMSRTSVSLGPSLRPFALPNLVSPPSSIKLCPLAVAHSLDVRQKAISCQTRSKELDKTPGGFVAQQNGDLSMLGLIILCLA